jgi:hypothetical protein
MTDNPRLRQIAVEDNIAWCSRVCSAHGSNERSSSSAWVNYARSPPFYPNLITRKQSVQDEVARQIGKIRAAVPTGKWGIKDSFADLAISELGFEQICAGHWYGGVVSNGSFTDWRAITSAAELNRWEKAWASSDAIFPSTLLADHKITFWSKGEAGAIEAGFISFSTASSLGISNWFSLTGASFAEMGVLQAAQSVSQGRPIVCWSTDELASEDVGLAKLGPLQVWVSQ